MEESLIEPMFSEFPVSRRVFLALGASAVVAACSSTDESPVDSVLGIQPATTSTPTSTVATVANTTTTPSVAPYTSPGWLAAENSLEGTRC